MSTCVPVDGELAAIILNNERYAEWASPETFVSFQMCSSSWDKLAGDIYI